MEVMRPVRLLAVLCLLLLAALVGPAPASAAVRDVRITQDGVSPQQLDVGTGDAVRFVNADSFLHRVVDDGGAWDVDATLLPGETVTTDPLTGAGRYAFRGAGLDRFTGTVVVAGTGTELGQVLLPRATTVAGPAPVAVTEEGGEAPPPVGPRPALGTPVEARRFGLPLVLATVLAGGVLSLLVRVLLAEAPGGPAEPTTA